MFTHFTNPVWWWDTRKQIVSINGFDFEVKEETCGVPQGFSLGPLYF